MQNILIPIIGFGLVILEKVAIITINDNLKKHLQYICKYLIFK